MSQKQNEKSHEKDKSVDKILIAIDGSEKADEALDFGLNLSHNLNAEVEVLTVIKTTIVPWVGSAPAGYGGTTDHMNPSYLDEFYEDQREYSRKIIEQAVNKAKKSYPNIKLSNKIVEGIPADMIVEEAKNDFDLIIVGHRGHGLIDSLLLGSVSKRVVDNSVIPVLVVK